VRTKILFNRKKKLNAQNEAAIKVEVYISRNNRTVKSTGVYIEPKYWDKIKNKKTSFKNIYKNYFLTFACY